MQNELERYNRNIREIQYAKKRIDKIIYGGTVGIIIIFGTVIYNVIERSIRNNIE